MRWGGPSLPAMLPDGFHWQATDYGYWLLRVGGVTVADYSSRPDAPYVLAYLRRGLASCGGRTFLSEAAARRYLEAWACKWQARIREAYRLPAHDSASAKAGAGGAAIPANPRARG